MSDQHSAAHAAEQAETRWVWIVAAIIALLLGMMAYMSLHWITMPPQRMETVNPGTLHLAGEFVEANLGSATEADGSVTVRLVGSQYSFTPQCVVVPADTPIVIRATSADVVHGFSVTGTNVNVNLVPGYVSTFHARFQKTGDHTMPCHEFCGIGHAAMWAHVKVVDKDTYARLAQKQGRLSCAEHS
ncbi:cytochrome C oxidase subunit II [Pseudoduganella sp. FT25W]|jgi:cytochrome c oxidase subunit 2|uniref:Cytochrome C oxidase subunit II n=1 Tax=Duganella alba TaxID=2666081 RepID=A0A6L5QGB5_9BURK|nr:cytochrome C oxidase subunit II [Duganella alba]MRX08670.1 cytochrome C oxidase subunit II [Duganella alba]MRX18232.1 cytochrome C oxidase subunit II [Duganella alba]